MSTSEPKRGVHVAELTGWLSNLFQAVLRLDKDPRRATQRVLEICMDGLKDNALSDSPEEDSLRSLDTLLDSLAAVAVKVPRGSGGAGGSNVPHLQQEVERLVEEGKLKIVVDQMMPLYQKKRLGQLRLSVLRMFGMQHITLDRDGKVLSASRGDLSVELTKCALGCRHYARNCKVFAECCKMYVTCRLCHNEAVLEDHEMDRFAVKRILCSLCHTTQPVGSTCLCCGILFARHYCPACKFFENTPGRQVYHCDKCGLCRRGEGLGIDNFHCDTCDACVSLASREHHKCQNSSLRASCPICCEYLFTSTKAVVFMRCGHAIHNECLNSHVKTSYRCPYCFKSLMNMRRYFEQIDSLVATETMPPEYANTHAIVFCNDCEKRSTTKYHYLYLKCKNKTCGGYNTRLLELVDPANPRLEFFLGDCEKR